MRQYQALQQQRQRNLQMMPQGQAGNTSVSQLLQNQYAAAAAGQGNQQGRPKYKRVYMGGTTHGGGGGDGQMMPQGQVAQLLQNQYAAATGQGNQQGRPKYKRVYMGETTHGGGGERWADDAPRSGSTAATEPVCCSHWSRQPTR